MQSIEAVKIQIGPVHYVNRTSLWNEFIKYIYIVDLAVGNRNKGGNVSTEI